MKFNCLIEKITLSQGPDSCEGTDDEQTITVEFNDAGGGHFYRLTEMNRWSMDREDSKELFRWLNSICEHNDKVEKELYAHNPEP